jgi:hypothetical protein
MGSFKKGMIVGYGIGYMQGAKAGRERYDQIMQKIKKVDLDKTLAPVKDQGQKVLTSVMEKSGDVKNKLARSSSNDSANNSVLPNTKAS